MANSSDVTGRDAIKALTEIKRWLGAIESELNDANVTGSFKSPAAIATAVTEVDAALIAVRNDVKLSDRLSTKAGKAGRKVDEYVSGVMYANGALVGKGC